MSQVALNFKFSGAPPRTLLGELTALSQIPTWWGGGSLPLPKIEPPPPLSALWALSVGPSGLALS